MPSKPGILEVKFPSEIDPQKMRVTLDLLADCFRKHGGTALKILGRTLELAPFYPEEGPILDKMKDGLDQVLNGPKPWGNQPSAPMQMVAWFFSLQGHVSNHQEGIIPDDKLIAQVREHIERAQTIVRHL